MGIFTRSAFLKGVLTPDIDNILPEKLGPLHGAVQKTLDFLGESVSNLSEVALRFCLSFAEVSSVLVGVRSIAELESNLAVFDKGPFPAETLQALRQFSLEDEELIRPTHLGWT